jgi:hypothetical protein
MNKAQKVIKIMSEADPSSSIQSRIHNQEVAIRDLQNAASKSKTTDKTNYLMDRIKVKKDQLNALKKQQAKPATSPKPTEPASWMSKHKIGAKPNNQSMGSPGTQGNVNALGAIPVGPLTKRKWRKNGTK